MRCVYEQCYYNVNGRCGIQYFEKKDGQFAERPNFCPFMNRPADDPYRDE